MYMLMVLLLVLLFLMTFRFPQNVSTYDCCLRHCLTNGGINGNRRSSMVLLGAMRMQCMYECMVRAVRFGHW